MVTGKAHKSGDWKRTRSYTWKFKKRKSWVLGSLISKVAEMILYQELNKLSLYMNVLVFRAKCM